MKLLKRLSLDVKWPKNIYYMSFLTKLEMIEVRKASVAKECLS